MSSPDDPHEFDPPMTRGDDGTNGDDSGPTEASDPGGTIDDDTKRMAQSRAFTEFGASWLNTPPPSTGGGTPTRGVFGKIAPGQVLYGKYQVVSKLGSGAMGDVWLVNHTSLKKHHALKLIVSNIASNEVALRRFQREFEVMASLDHPHAVRIYDACIDGDGGYIDMEYVQGQTLHDILGAARKQPDHDPSAPLMPLDWVVRVVDQLTEVLEEAHEKGIVHRDLKPSNLMLLDGKKPGKEYLKVLDFGIAKIRDDPDNAANMTLTQGFIGTPSYGSPEQAMNREDIDGRSDLYSVGVMLYEFVTGRLPFRGVHFQVMNQHANVPPPPFAEANPQLRPVPELERVILRSLAKDRDHRPQTAREFFGEIRKAVEILLGPDAVGLTPPSWELFRPTLTGSGIAPSPTELDGPMVTGFAPVGPATLTIPAAPKTPAKPSSESSEAFGPAIVDDRPRRWLWAVVGGLLVGVIVILGVVDYLRNRPERLAEIVKKPLNIQIPDGYIDPTHDDRPGVYPSKLRRVADNVYFDRFSDDGIYLPVTYEAENDKDLAEDGWPRRIRRKNDPSKTLFVRIAGNSGESDWSMGAWTVAPDAQQDDAPAHPVFLSTGYYLQMTEVTNGQFADYIKETGHSRPSFWDSTFNEKKAECNDLDLARKHPAVNLSHKEALEYAIHVQAMLPTEAQWEFAARSRGQLHRFVWGNKPLPDRALANIHREDKYTTVPVGSFEKDRTEQGLLDMTGNVQEMCRDVFRRYLVKTVALVDPSEGPGGSGSVEYVIRGGFFLSEPEECTTTRRDDHRPLDEYAGNLGFRLVIECPDARPRKGLK